MALFKRKTGPKGSEREKIERLEKAERDLGNLQHRAHVAATTLDDRARRNHWRESIEELIQGAH